MPASVLAHTPPPAAPIQMRSGWAGWHTSAVQRPPMFVGPASSHGEAFVTELSLRAALVRTATSRAPDASRSGHVTRARNHPLRGLCLLLRGGGGPRLRVLRGPWAMTGSPLERALPTAFLRDLPARAATASPVRPLATVPEERIDP